MSDPTGTIDSLATYAPLGRSGLLVSPLCLGTMTFGTDWGWGVPLEVARPLFARYLEAGGNFIDTADRYTNGSSETILGQLIEETRSRDRVVVATKFSMSAEPGNPNAGGNPRKNIHRALEGSLRRLRTDYVDLYWLHCWDGITPVEEVLTTVDALVRSGKVRYFGLSDTPAWYLARAQTLAEGRGWEPVIALQLEYSLIERNLEREHVPAALALGMGICPWSPLGGGLLTGKYVRGEGEGRRTSFVNPAPAFAKLFAARSLDLADALVAAAQELGRPPAQVALNWVTRRPGVASTILGATRLAQLEENLHALDFELPPEVSRRLEEISRPEMVFPYSFFTPERCADMRGGVRLARPPGK